MGENFVSDEGNAWNGNPALELIHMNRKQVNHFFMLGIYC